MSRPIRLFQPRDVLLIRFPQHTPQGHEQEDYRPAIVVGLPDQISTPRFPMLVVVPMTTARAQSWMVASPELYPRFACGVGNLTRDSIALTDQVRSIDPVRVERILGTLSSEEYRPVLAGVCRMLCP